MTYVYYELLKAYANSKIKTQILSKTYLEPT